MTSIVVLSDTHRLHPDVHSRSMFPRHFDRLSRAEAEHGYRAIRDGIEHAYHCVLTSLQNLGSCTYLIHLGDVTSGYREHGTKSMSGIARATMHDLRQSALSVQVCVGNHDTGYNRDTGNIIADRLSAGMITAESVEICQDVYGPLWWYEKSSILLLGLCSPVACYTGNDARLRDLRRQQSLFVQRALRMHPDLPWIMFAHSPALPDDIAKAIEPHLARLQYFVFGDLHRPDAIRMLRLQAQMKALLSRSAAARTQAACLRKGVLCPSVAPVWWRGYGYLHMRVQPDHTEIEQRRVNHPLIAPLPTSSFFTCLRWLR